MSRQLTRALPLAEYAEAVALATPYSRAEPLLARDRPAVTIALTEWLLAHQSGRERRPTDSRTQDETRSLLRVLLTVRPPSPFPEEFLAPLDRLLEGELRDRGIVDTSALQPLVTEEGTDLLLWRGDITTLRVDAIVNAANSALLGCFRPLHACIDNAIHCAAGPRLREDCATIMRLQGREEPAGCAKATRAYNLPSRFVFHTVGPIAKGAHNRAHANALALCYHACLDKGRELGDVRSLALCGISTGVFGYPKEPACTVAVETVRRWLRANPGVYERIVFNVFSAEDHGLYERALTSSAQRGRVS